MRRLADRLRGEEGVAMILVVFGVAFLATLSVILIDTVSSESARSAKAVTRQTSFEAAESGLDDYIAKLADDRSYYLHWVHPAESTRRDSSSALVSASGSSPAPSTWCRDTGSIKSRPAPTAWAYGTNWTYPNGKNHWCDLGNGYEFNLQITPPTATQTGVTILVTGRKISNTLDTRVVEAVVKQSTIADFQRIVNGNVGWGSGATTYGPLYANGNIDHAGTARGSVYATGCLGVNSCSGSVNLQNGAVGFDGSGSTSYTNLFSPPSTLTSQIDFNSFLTSFSDISSAATDSGLSLTPTSVTSNGATVSVSSKSSYWLTFNSTGTVSVKGCTGGSIETSDPTATCATVAGSPFPVPTNGAIYSQVSVMVQGTLKGRVTVASDDEIVIANTLLYDGDNGNFDTPQFGVNVLGLEARNDVLTPSWAPLNLDWRAAVLSQTRTWKSYGSSPSCSMSPNTMNHRGSAATDDGGSFAGRYCERNYLYDDSLTYLSPPWFPTLDPDYKIVSFRELPAS